MIDWHSHILPGLDDGAGTLDDALEMGRLLASAGFTVVHCTPHCLRGMYDNRPDAVRGACADLQQAFDRAGIAIRLQTGMEYCLDEFFPDYLDDLLPLGDSRLVLVETPSMADLELLKENIFLLRRAGFEPLFAHPERHGHLAPPADAGFVSAFFKRGREQAGEGIDATPLADLVGMGCKFQGNLGSIAGYYGRMVQKQMQRFLGYDLYSCIGSDAHNPQALQRFLQSGLDVIEARAPQLLDGNHRLE